MDNQIMLKRIGHTLDVQIDALDTISKMSGSFELDNALRIIKQLQSLNKALNAPPTEAEIEAAAKAVFHTAETNDCFVNETMAIECARAALEAAAKVRRGE